MKEETRWKVMIGIILINVTLLLMIIHFLLFHDAEHLFIYFVGDLVFLPVEVLCVTLIIEEMLESRERQQRMEKLNMVIGIFFSRVGTPLLAQLAKADSCSAPLREQVSLGTNWDAGMFRAAHAGLGHWKCSLDPTQVDRDAMKTFLATHEDFLLRIVENPMVFEHESFTDLIFAITHLTAELNARSDLSRLPATDILHLNGDMERVYLRMVPEWLHYMEYLKRSYPYLFSLAMRQNPFDTKANVVVE
nr:hypothetical protein [uncultured Methanoregula sp.]